jgi:hypothetical protein
MKITISPLFSLTLKKKMDSSGIVMIWKIAGNLTEKLKKLVLMKQEYAIPLRKLYKFILRISSNRMILKNLILILTTGNQILT